MARSLRWTLAGAVAAAALAALWPWGERPTSEAARPAEAAPAEADVGAARRLAEPEPAAPPIPEEVPSQAARSALSATDAAGEASTEHPLAVDDGSFERDAVYGLVRSADGELLTGADVELHAEIRPGLHGVTRLPDRLGSPRARAVTDAAGRFRFGGLRPLAVHPVAVTLEGYVDFSATLRTGADAELVLRPAGAIEGRVTDAGSGAPLAGVRVVSHLTHGRAEPRGATSDGDGRYRVDGLYRGQEHTLTFDRSGYATRQETVAVPASGLTLRDVALSAGRPLTVEFFERATGRPVPGAELEFGGLSLGRADDRGRLEVRVPTDAERLPGELVLRASAPEYCTTRFTLEAAVLVGLGLARVPLARGGVLQGRVLDAEGSPIEGARVEATFLILSTFRDVDGLEASYLRGEGSELTDEDGAYRLTAVPPGFGAVELAIAGPDGARALLHVLEPDAEGRALPDVVLHRPVRVHGIVRRDGEPEVARVAYGSGTGPLGTAGAVSSFVRTNDGGEYAIDGLPPGELRLTALPRGSSAHGDFPAQVVRTVGAGEELRIDLEIEAGPLGRLSGTVVGADGGKVEGARVQAFRFGPSGMNMAHTSTDVHGAWALEVLSEDAAAEYQVSASFEGRRASETGVPLGTRDLELRLPEADGADER